MTEDMTDANPLEDAAADLSADLEGERVEVKDSSVGAVQGGQVSMADSAARSVNAQALNMTDSAAGFVRANSLDMRDAGIGIAISPGNDGPRWRCRSVGVRSGRIEGTDNRAVDRR